MLVELLHQIALQFMVIVKHFDLSNCINMDKSLPFDLTTRQIGVLMIIF